MRRYIWLFFHGFPQAVLALSGAIYSFPDIAIYSESGVRFLTYFELETQGILCLVIEFAMILFRCNLGSPYLVRHQCLLVLKGLDDGFIMFMLIYPPPALKVYVML